MSRYLRWKERLMIDHETHLMIARERMETTIRQAAREAAAVPDRGPGRVRRQVGTMLIATGRRLTAERSSPGAHAAPDAPALTRPV
jgi:hypothetical protein